MKLAVILVSLLAYAFAKSFNFDTSDYNTAYGYLTRYGIPVGERIQKAEKEYLKGQTSRIVGGSPSAHGQFKYQAGLISDIIGITGRGVCGGSLISPNRVLTAAHCWFDGRNRAWRFTVVLDSVLLFSGGTRLESTDVVMHARWFPQLIRNDIAVIRLPSPVTLSATVGIISLPSKDQLNENFVGAEATASGFGITKDDGSITAGQFLSHVRLDVISNLRCSLAFPLILQPSNICTATTDGQSTCRGDSGGPLVIDKDGEPVLIGITSFGSALGCEMGSPAVFVRVTSYNDFIKENL
ncbi:brachyurin-like [Maniola hyperantus]|uniref:brachyurin-like n=1 Tax=Aphantopus hyperantus TaxID=2795564 RepID=UPI001569B0AC|nr:brachyurin-like [Maniola hyperantus]